jgi:chemotaxis protein histidine kinase CheA
VTQGNRGRTGIYFDLGALQEGSASVDKLHDKARRAIESGEEKFRDVAEYLAEAQKLGASQRQSAQAIGMSPAWVNALLKWRRSGYRDRCPFPRSNRRVQPAERRMASPRPASSEQAQAQAARADAERAKAEAQKAKAEASKAQAEFQKARAEAASRMFGPQIQTIPQRARELLIKALRMLGYRDLQSRRYVHGGYHAFNISDPKPRNIHKASMRDRLLHHALYRKTASAPMPIV